MQRCATVKQVGCVVVKAHLNGSFPSCVLLCLFRNLFPQLCVCIYFILFSKIVPSMHQWVYWALFNCIRVGPIRLCTTEWKVATSHSLATCEDNETLKQKEPRDSFRVRDKNGSFIIDGFMYTATVGISSKCTNFSLPFSFAFFLLPFKTKKQFLNECDQQLYSSLWTSSLLLSLFFSLSPFFLLR